MKPLFLAIFAGAAFCGFAQSSKVPQSSPITWVFLNTGKAHGKTKEMSEAEVTKMQAAHIGNFGSLFDKGRLLAAGPLGDKGEIRGTAVLNVDTPVQVSECFKPDPLVQNNMLEVEQHPWLVNVMLFGSPKVPFQMAQSTLCLVKKGKNWKTENLESSPDALLRFFPHLKEKESSGELAITGPFLDDTGKLGILMFSSSNQIELRAELEKATAVADGRVDIELHPQLLGVGTFRSPGDSSPAAGERTPLFDRTTFKGWEGETNRTWRIEGGALVGGSLKETVPHNDFICTTRSFKNFDLRLKVQLNGQGFVNGGVQIRSQRLKNPAFEMTGYQADMGEGFWGCLYDESRRNKVMAHPHAAIIKQLVKVHDWNDYIIRCEDKHIRLWLNGMLTVDYTEADSAIPLEGLIGLQIHGGGKAEASYKDISISVLP